MNATVLLLVSALLISMLSFQARPGAEVSQEQKNRIQQAIQTNPDTAPDGVFSESKQEAFDSFKKLYKDSPIVSTVTQDQMQESFRVKLKDPTKFNVVASAFSLTKNSSTVAMSISGTM